MSEPTTEPTWQVIVSGIPTDEVAADMAARTKALGLEDVGMTVTVEDRKLILGNIAGPDVAKSMAERYRTSGVEAFGMKVDVEEVR